MDQHLRGWLVQAVKMDLVIIPILVVKVVDLAAAMAVLLQGMVIMQPPIRAAVEEEHLMVPQIQHIPAGMVDRVK